MKRALAVLLLPGLLLSPRPAAADPSPPLTMAEVGGGAIFLALAAGAVAVGCHFKGEEATKTRCVVVSGLVSGGMLGIGIPLFIAGKNETYVSSLKSVTLFAMEHGGALAWAAKF